MKFRLALTIFVVFLAGCAWTPQKQPSVLVIAVEGLSFDSFSCTSEVMQASADFAGLRVFCDEAVRFTHAYAPSTLSQPTLSSVLTGLFPMEHGVRNQGGDFLRGSFETIQEKAVKKGYRTMFYSGGAPLWRKSGLAQGFEIFEDNIAVNRGQFYRPLERSSELFLLNLKNKVREDAFFSVIFANDILFADETTVNSSGEIRSRTVQSQLLEVSESIHSLVTSLKRLGRWDNTHVILLGTNGGVFNRRPEEERGYSLFSSNTQVKLFIKPATRKRDLGLQWTIDRNVSLVDVGRTLFDLIQVEPGQISRFDVHTLANVLKEPTADWPERRVIMTESAWPSWQGVGVNRYSLRWDQYLLIYDQKPQLYNTLIDRQELAKIEKDDPLVKVPMEIFNSFIESNKLEAWRPLPETLAEKLAIARQLWRPEPLSESLMQRLRHVSKKRTWDTQVWGWLARELIQQERWKELVQVAGEAGQSSWMYLAHQKTASAKRRVELTGCEKTLSDFADVPSLRDCDDTVFSSFAAWVREKDPAKLIHQKERFLREYQEHLIDIKISEMNFHNGLTWSVNKKYPEGPGLAEIALKLPRMEGFERQVRSRVGNENL